MKAPVLFVDDEEGIRNSIRRIFRFRPDFEADLAADAEEALAKLRKKAYHIIVSDQSMPGMSGDALLEIVKTEFPDVIRIILTAYGTLELATRAMNELGVFGFLQKPLKKKSLIETLRKSEARYQDNQHIQMLRRKYDKDFPLSKYMENLRIILTEWHPSKGLNIVGFQPKKSENFDILQLANQAFMAFIPAGSDPKTFRPSQITMPIHYLKMDARIHIESLDANQEAKDQFAIIVIAPSLDEDHLDPIIQCMEKFAKHYRATHKPELFSLNQCIQSKLQSLQTD